MFKKWCYAYLINISVGIRMSCTRTLHVGLSFFTIVDATRRKLIQSEIFSQGGYFLRLETLVGGKIATYLEFL